MEKIKIQVSGNQIEVAERPAAITAGTVGLTAEFSFDSQWDTLSKTAVFKAGDKVVATALEQNIRSVPWEVLARPNLWLSIGVYGANTDGTVVIPTQWAKVSVIYTGTDPEGDPALDPTAPVWQELLTRVDNITAESIGATPIATVEEISGQLEQLDKLAGDVDWKINHHINNGDGDNPHGVTAEQIGAATRDEMDAVQEHLLILNDEFYSHQENAANPHGVTAEQIGAATKDDFEDTLTHIQLVEAQIGDIETALDGILAMQNERIGGDAV